jgi:hypothetical protein
MQEELLLESTKNQQQFWKIHFCSFLITSNLLIIEQISEYVSSVFIKSVYWFSMQEELLLESTKNQQQFWKQIGKIGVAENRKSIIPMEVIDDNGNVSSQLTEVLNRRTSIIVTFVPSLFGRVHFNP